MLLGSASSIFLEATTYNPGGDQTNALAIGDLNGDGKLDVVVSDGCSDSSCTNGGVSVLLGNGDGSFQPAVTYSSGGTQATSVTIADVNGDGKPDIIVANANDGYWNPGSVGILLGNGDGTFQAAVTYSSGGVYAQSVVIGDVNGDGKPDLLVGNACPLGDPPYCDAGPTLGVLPGNGDGTFQAAVTYNSGGSGAQSLATGDLNGDGKLDVVVGNSGNVSVLLGNGDGSFQAPAQIYADGGYVAVADVNGDGKLDVLVVNQLGDPENTTSPSGAVSVLLGNGNGTFTLAQYYTGAVNGRIVIVDVNGDGKLDLVVGSSCELCGNSGVGILLGNGDGSFQPAQIYASAGYATVSVAVADLNGDGKPDIAVTNSCANGGDCSDSSLGVLLGNGDGTFLGAVIYQVAGLEFAESAAVADLNGDGKLDMVFADPYGPTGTSGDVIVLLGNGNGTFQPEQWYSSGAYGTVAVAIADVNNDGKPDLVVASECNSSEPLCESSGFPGQVAILLGNGDGTFQPAQTYNSGGSFAVSIAVADLNGDGNLDIVVANVNSNTFAVLLGNGDGTFQPANSFASGGYAPVSVVVADVNGDGKPDVLLSNDCADSSCQSNGVISVLLGDGKGGFAPLQNYSSGGNLAGALALADFNGDGKLDVVVYNLCAPGVAKYSCETGADGVMGVLLGNGDGTFQAAVTSSVPAELNQGGSLTVADFNGDGKPDVASGVFLALGNGDGTFQTPLILGAWSPGSAVGDFNGDSKPDLAVGGGNVVVLLNITPTFTKTTLASSENPSQYEQAVTFTATVTPKGYGTPTGTVTFYDGTTALGTQQLTNGSAQYSTSTLTVGSHSITAVYSGDSNFQGSTPSPLNQIVNQASTTVSVGSSVNPSSYDQAVTFTATISSQFGGSSTGTVTFYSGKIRIGSGQVSNNTAKLTIRSLSVGNHSITAAYSGDSNFTGSTSSPLDQVVDRAVTTTILTSSKNPSQYGQKVTFTATVTGQHGGTPTGTVTFKSGAIVLGKVMLSGGMAKYRTSTLAKGKHLISAHYGGNKDFKVSEGKLIQVVK